MTLPPKEHTDVARHSSRKIEDFDAEFVAKRAHFLVIVLVRLLREALERTWPVRIIVVDPATAIIAIAGGKRDDAKLGITLLGGPLDRGIYALGDLRVKAPFHEGLAKALLLLLLLLGPLYVLLRLCHVGFVGNFLQIVGPHKIGHCATSSVRMTVGSVDDSGPLRRLAAR